MANFKVCQVMFDDNARSHSNQSSEARTKPDERLYRVLVACGWNVSMASRVLGCSRTTIYKHIRRNGWDARVAVSTD